MNIDITAFTPADRPAWEPLARGYKAFYQTATSDAEYDTTWNRLVAQDARNPWPLGQPPVLG